MPLGGILGGGIGAALGFLTKQSSDRAARRARDQNLAYAADIGERGQKYLDWTEEQSQQWNPNAHFAGQWGRNVGDYLGTGGTGGWGDIAKEQAETFREQGNRAARLANQYADDIRKAGKWAGQNLQSDPAYMAQRSAMRNAQDANWGNAGGFLSGAHNAAAARAGADLAGQHWNNLYNRRQQELSSRLQAQQQGLAARYGGWQQGANALQTPYSQLIAQRYNIQNPGQIAARDAGIQQAQASMGATNQYASQKMANAMLPLMGAQAGANMGMQWGGMQAPQAPQTAMQNFGSWMNTPYVQGSMSGWGTGGVGGRQFHQGGNVWGR